MAAVRTPLPCSRATTKIPTVDGTKEPNAVKTNPSVPGMRSPKITSGIHNNHETAYVSAKNRLTGCRCTVVGRRKAPFSHRWW